MKIISYTVYNQTFLNAGVRGWISYGHLALILFAKILFACDRHAHVIYVVCEMLTSIRVSFSASFSSLSIWIAR